jgi:hypothetical protein
MACAVEISKKGANMYQIIASKRKILSTKKTFELAGVVILIIAALFLAGCSTGVGYDLDETTSGRALLDDPEDPPSIYGTWLYTYDYLDDYGDRQYGYDKYVIVEGEDDAPDTLTYTSVYYPDEDWNSTFTAEIVQINLNGDGLSGVIIIEYIVPPTGGNAGWYNAVYFDELEEKLTGDTVKLANAVILSNYNSSQVATLLEAQTNFTWANAVNYIYWGIVNPMIRQP